MIDKVLKIINLYLVGNYPNNDNYPFYLELEELLFQNYEEMVSGNKKLTIELNENIPDICAECEPGFDEKEFKIKILNELKRIESVLNLKLLEKQ